MIEIKKDSYYITKENKPNPMAFLSVSEPIFYTGNNIDSSSSFMFTVDMIEVFDVIITKNDTNLGTISQVELFNKYTANAVTELVDEQLKQLDSYLGGYKGEINDEYYKHIYRS